MNVQEIRDKEVMAKREIAKEVAMNWWQRDISEASRAEIIDTYKELPVQLVLDRVEVLTNLRRWKDSSLKTSYSDGVQTYPGKIIDQLEEERNVLKFLDEGGFIGTTAAFCYLSDVAQNLAAIGQLFDEYSHGSSGYSDQVALLERLALGFNELAFEQLQNYVNL